MSKRKAEESQTVSGFMHNVSPIKRSAKNNPYFHGFIQTESDVYKKVVCFDVQKHTVLNQAEMSKTPVKLLQISEVPNREDATRSDVLINSRSLVQTSRQLNFMHHARTEPAVSVEMKTIEQINHIPERNTISILIKVIRKKDVSVQELRGEFMKKQDIIVGDHTGSITLTLWDKLVDQELLVEETYQIQNVSTRMMNGKKTLTTTKQTKMTKAQEDIENVVQTEDVDTIKTIDATVANISIKASNQCPSCKKKITIASDSAYVRCEQCHMKHKVAALSQSLLANINFQYENNLLKLTAFNATLVKVLTKQLKEDLKQDVDRFENFLLDQDTIRIEYSSEDNIITNMDLINN